MGRISIDPSINIKEQLAEGDWFLIAGNEAIERDQETCEFIVTQDITPLKKCLELRQINPKIKIIVYIDTPNSLKPKHFTLPHGNPTKLIIPHDQIIPEISQHYPSSVYFCFEGRLRASKDKIMKQIKKSGSEIVLKDFLFRPHKLQKGKETSLLNCKGITTSLPLRLLTEQTASRVFWVAGKDSKRISNGHLQAASLAVERILGGSYFAYANNIKLPLDKCGTARCQINL